MNVVGTERVISPVAALAVIWLAVPVIEFTKLPPDTPRLIPCGVFVTTTVPSLETILAHAGAEPSAPMRSCPFDPAVELTTPETLVCITPVLKDDTVNPVPAVILPA